MIILEASRILYGDIINPFFVLDWIRSTNFISWMRETQNRQIMGELCPSLDVVLIWMKYWCDNKETQVKILLIDIVLGLYLVLIVLSSGMLVFLHYWIQSGISKARSYIPHKNNKPVYILFPNTWLYNTILTKQPAYLTPQ